MKMTDRNLFPKTAEEEIVKLSRLELVGAGHQPTRKKGIARTKFPSLLCR